MSIRPNSLLIEFITVCVFFMTVWCISNTANAKKPAESKVLNTPEKVLPVLNHEIGEGDSLSSIAVKYNVKLEALKEVNKIVDADKIFLGSKILIPGDPENGVLSKKGVKIVVPNGFTLSRIASLYKIPVKRIIKANKLKNPDKLRAGAKILIPGAKKIVELIPKPPCYKDPVTLYRVQSGETQKVSLCFCNGKPNPKALDILSDLAGPIKKPAPFPLHERLLVLLQKVADKYPGKRIEVVSGQRKAKVKGRESFHTKGKAIDFRIQGVSNRTLSQFVRTFKNVGVGYYPNSVFIHMDTRKRNGYWVDYSRPGEKAIYGKSGLSAETVEAIREKRRMKSAKKVKEALLKKITDNIEATQIPNLQEKHKA